MHKIRISTRPLLNLSQRWNPLTRNQFALPPAFNCCLRQSSTNTTEQKLNDDWQYHTGYWIPFARFGPQRRMKIYTKPPSLKDRERVATVDRRVYSVTTLCAIGGMLFFLLADAPKQNGQIFDAPRFTSFTIIGKELVSTTAFILTVRPDNAAGLVEDPYTKEWKHGTWSVEFKQPQLQIARSYTPLPSPTVDARFDSKPGDLRFVIRREESGEVSNYLAGLPVGRKVELRGPHLGIELPGYTTEVLFLAGGTGIAPAMQVAHKLLEADATASARMHIVWANRRREDCLPTSCIPRELEALQHKHPGNFKMTYLVDAEQTLIDHKQLSTWTKNVLPGKSGFVTRTDSKLLFVSGPEGFMNVIAGAKKWEDGKEQQGEISGLLKRLGPRDWKVIKL
ncbi:hypothetical protein BJ878DRAFT_497416 [Calycina marina]|uniref:FAD-binding FR-type domain-containing protein n=1 Tax=Calycina marina TaxID=1763456 RepID=A0A9P7Z663_9HELO|nr:hypothetical protein BJ878DRAFT_497416 [Calycina marina]